MKRWFTDILTQNLLYPANLWAMQKLESNITSGNDSVIKLKEEKEQTHIAHLHLHSHSERKRD